MKEVWKHTDYNTGKLNFLVHSGTYHGSHSRCLPDFEVSWSRDLSSTAFAATPVIADIDADGSLDVLAGTFSGDVYAVNGNTGKTIPNSHWPVRLPEASIHSSPVLVSFCAAAAIHAFLMLGSTICVAPSVGSAWAFQK